MTMKKILMLFILFLLSMNVVFAGHTYRLDFSEKDNFLVGLKSGDRVEFNLKGERNTVILTKIRESSVEVKAYIALDIRNIPYYSDLKKGNKFVMDVDNDGVKDIEVKLYKIQDDIAALYFNKLGGSLWPVGNVVIDTETDGVIRSNRTYDIITVGFFVLVGIIMVAFILKQYRSRKIENVEKFEEKSK